MLNKQKLQQSLINILEKDSNDFIGYSDSINSAALLFANSFYNYAVDILPQSSTHNAAKEIFIEQFKLINELNYKTQFQNAYIQYVITMTQGMQPAFSAVMPTVQLNFSLIFETAKLLFLKGRDVAILLTNQIHAYMLSGTAINNNSGATIVWN